MGQFILLLILIITFYPSLHLGLVIMSSQHDQLGIFGVRVPVVMSVPHVLQGLVVALVQIINQLSRNRST